MHKRRLLKLADLLDADAKNKKGIRFDLRTWGFSKKATPKVDCGTTACAMGLAALSGAFKHQGLRARAERFGNTIEVNVTMPNSRSGLHAAMDLFDINYDTAEWLFTAETYRHDSIRGSVGERAVAKRIRAIVAGDDSPDAGRE